MPEKPELKRSLSLPMLALYGLGTTIGAGIYSLIGEVTNIAGMQAPAAFLMAAIMASLTAFSFAELASRFPRSAGEAFYIQKAFELKWLSLVIGLMVVFAGVVSAAAIANAFVGYLHEFLDVSRVTAIILIIG
ncbi:MAG: amino acid permease, partial [Rhodospirillales bacterium]|nr:amino acid permease [Rhodospirillales bacterium]